MHPERTLATKQQPTFEFVKNIPYHTSTMLSTVQKDTKVMSDNYTSLTVKKKLHICTNVTNSHIYTSTASQYEPKYSEMIWTAYQSFPIIPTTTPITPVYLEPEKMSEEKEKARGAERTEEMRKGGLSRTDFGVFSWFKSI